MSELRDELARRARELSPEERAELVQELLESIDEQSSPDVHDAWEKEIARRVDAYERGDAKLIPAEEVFDEARRLTR